MSETYQSMMARRWFPSGSATIHKNHVVYFTRRPVRLDSVIDADDVILPSGKRPINGEPIDCEICGANLSESPWKFVSRLDLRINYKELIND